MYGSEISTDKNMKINSYLPHALLWKQNETLGRALPFTNGTGRLWTDTAIDMGSWAEKTKVAIYGRFVTYRLGIMSREN